MLVHSPDVDTTSSPMCLLEVESMSSSFIGFTVPWDPVTALGDLATLDS